MPIAVTGGGGFIGNALIKHLLSENKQVKTLVRKRVPEFKGAEIIHGDLLDRNALKNLLTDCGCLIHLAYENSNDASAPSETEAANIRGTKELFESAVECGVSRIIYLSSAEVHEHNHRAINEDVPLKVTCDSLLAKHKIDCEHILENLSYKTNVDYVILRPTAVYGPGDEKMISLFKTVEEGKFFYIGSGLNHVPLLYINDLLESISTCILHPVAADKKYILTGPNETLKHLIKTIAQELNVPPPKLQIPEMPVKTAVHICEKLFPLLKSIPPITQASLKLFTEHSQYSAARIKNDLNLQLNTSLETGIKNTIAEYLKKHNH